MAKDTLVVPSIIHVISLPNLSHSIILWIISLSEIYECDFQWGYKVELYERIQYLLCIFFQ